MVPFTGEATTATQTHSFADYASLKEKGQKTSSQELIHLTVNRDAEISVVAFVVDAYKTQVS